MMTMLPRHERDRTTIQQIYVRVCRDSGFGLDSIRAATLTANMVGCSPLEVWLAMPSLDVMDEIAAGQHPVAKGRRQQ
jgi:hypothetical protein